MENASKALIIAGAILISILLISVGIIIMNSINEPVQQGADTAAGQAIEMFNSKFLAYEGVDIKGSSLRTLISAVNANNGTDEDNPVTINGNDAPTINDIPNYSPNNEYDVTITYGGTDGRVSEITIAE